MLYMPPPSPPLPLPLNSHGPCDQPVHQNIGTFGYIMLGWCKLWKQTDPMHIVPSSCSNIWYSFQTCFITRCLVGWPILAHQHSQDKNLILCTSAIDSM